MSRSLQQQTAAEEEERGKGKSSQTTASSSALALASTGAKAEETITKLQSSISNLVPLIHKSQTEHLTHQESKRVKNLAENVIGDVRKIFNQHLLCHKVIEKKREKEEKTGIRQCHSCGTLKTPEWRRGPDGPRTLCNACGLKITKRAKRLSDLAQKKSITKQKDDKQKKGKAKKLDIQQQQQKENDQPLNNNYTTFQQSLNNTFTEIQPNPILYDPHQPVYHLSSVLPLQQQPPPPIPPLYQQPFDLNTCYESVPCLFGPYSSDVDLEPQTNLFYGDECYQLVNDDLWSFDILFFHVANNNNNGFGGSLPYLPSQLD